MNIIKNNFRYPGTTPFSLEQSHIFFGRGNDIQCIIDNISTENMLLIHGKSGLGKTSLINAGVLPVLNSKSEYIPVQIRIGPDHNNNVESKLDSNNDSQKFSPLEILKKEIFSKTAESVILNANFNDNSLWAHTKNLMLYERENHKIQILIFDQFEEFFLHNNHEKAKFMDELAEVCNGTMPSRFITKLETSDLNTEDIDLIYEKTPIKVIFILRSDKIVLLDEFKDYFPNIFNNTYILKALSLKDARDAVVKPAISDGSFITSKFEYSDKALAIIINFLKNNDDNLVEGILLQMVCEYYETKLIFNQNKNLIEENDLTDISNIIDSYYNEKINSSPINKRDAYKNLIEETLLSENEIRLSIHEDQIVAHDDVSRDDLDALINLRLIRTENYIRGGLIYEISHDRLIPALVKSRTLRRENERANEMKKKEDEYKRSLLKATEEYEKEKYLRDKARFNYNLFIGSMFLVILISSYFMIKNAASTRNRAIEVENELKQKKEYLLNLNNLYLKDAYDEIGNDSLEQALNIFSSILLNLDTNDIANNGIKESINNGKELISEKKKNKLLLSQKFNEFDSLLNNINSIFSNKKYGAVITNYNSCLNLYLEFSNLSASKKSQDNKRIELFESIEKSIKKTRERIVKIAANQNFNSESKELEKLKKELITLLDKKNELESKPQ